jgi:hypothetical protein
MPMTAKKKTIIVYIVPANAHKSRMSSQQKIISNVNAIFPEFAHAPEIARELSDTMDYVAGGLRVLGEARTMQQMCNLTRGFADGKKNVALFVSFETRFERANNTVDSVTEQLETRLAPFSLFGDVTALTQHSFLWTISITLDEATIRRLYDTVRARSVQDAPKLDPDEVERRELERQLSEESRQETQQKRERITRRVLAKAPAKPLDRITIKPKRQASESDKKPVESRTRMLAQRFLEFVLAVPSAHSKNRVGENADNADLFFQKTE